MRLGAAETARENDGLVSHWMFCSSLDDRAGRSRDNLAPATGTARFVSASELLGTIDGAVALGVEPGDAPYLAAKSGPDVKLGPSYTIEAWIHPTRIAL